MTDKTLDQQLGAFQKATREMAKAYRLQQVEIHKAAIEAGLKGKKFTGKHNTQAMDMAKGDTVRMLYELPEYDGVSNPTHHDEVWGVKATAAAAAPAQTVKANKYAGTCTKCGGHVPAEAGALVKTPDGKWGADHIGDCPAAPAPAAKVEGLDLSSLPSGYYAVPQGDTRLKVAISQGRNNWEGFTFVKDAAEYGQQQRYGMQRPGQTYSGQHQG